MDNRDRRLVPNLKKSGDEINDKRDFRLDLNMMISNLWAYFLR